MPTDPPYWGDACGVTSNGCAVADLTLSQQINLRALLYLCIWCLCCLKKCCRCFRKWCFKYSAVWERLSGDLTEENWSSVSKWRTPLPVFAVSLQEKLQTFATVYPLTPSEDVDPLGILEKINVTFCLK